jgi:hypothetical protein
MDIKELEKNIAMVEKEKEENLLTHFTKRAYKNDNVLIALMRKLLPDKAQDEITGDFKLIIKRPGNK